MIAIKGFSTLLTVVLAPSITSTATISLTLKAVANLSTVSYITLPFLSSNNKQLVITSSVVNRVGLPDPLYSFLDFITVFINAFAISSSVAAAAAATEALTQYKSSSLDIGLMQVSLILSSESDNLPSPTNIALAISSSSIILISIFNHATTSKSVMSTTSSLSNFCFLYIVVGVVVLFSNVNTSSFFLLPLI